MKLLLDELWPPSIAEHLRRRGVNCIAAKEAAHVDRYCNIHDDEVFTRAQEDERTVVTDNVADYEEARADWERNRASPHYGVIYAVDPPFNRHKSEALVGQMVRALDYLLHQLPARSEPLNRVHWLRSAPSDFD